MGESGRRNMEIPITIRVLSKTNSQFYKLLRKDCSWLDCWILLDLACQIIPFLVKPRGEACPKIGWGGGSIEFEIIVGIAKYSIV